MYTEKKTNIEYIIRGANKNCRGVNQMDYMMNWTQYMVSRSGILTSIISYADNYANRNRPKISNKFGKGKWKFNKNDREQAVDMARKLIVEFPSHDWAVFQTIRDTETNLVASFYQ